MAFYKGLIPLRDVLADLYPAAGLAQVVVAEAGIPLQFIDFNGAATEVWQRILLVAQGNNQVQNLIDVARKHYPKNEALAEAEQVFQSTPAPDLPSGTEAAGDRTAAPGGPHTTITIGGSNSGIVAGGNVRGASVVATGNITGDGNVVGSDRKVDP